MICQSFWIVCLCNAFVREATSSCHQSLPACLSGLSPGFAALQIRDEDLQSAGNLDKARDLEVVEQIEDAEREEVFEEQMEHGLEADGEEGVSLVDFSIRLP